MNVRLTSLKRDKEDFEDELDETIETHLMDNTMLVEGILFELGHEYQLRVEEHIGNKPFAFKADLAKENERTALSLIRVEKYIDTKSEMYRRIDEEYQHTIAEAFEAERKAITEAAEVSFTKIIEAIQCKDDTNVKILSKGRDEEGQTKESGSHAPCLV
ncbi:mRNA export factor GLE1-like isoform X2 [Tasmannia lanceolata]|uniref:mRNA export factor GLE1-like isoform X2 n=1 Tax=Tasmannia lanceolata TaxID=3420 RepID=UPI0040647DE5